MKPGAKGGKKVIIEPHRHAGVFVARGGREDLMATVNLVPGDSVYGEKRISVEAPPDADGTTGPKTEYRVSSPPSRRDALAPRSRSPRALTTHLYRFGTPFVCVPLRLDLYSRLALTALAKVRNWLRAFSADLRPSI